MLASSTLDALSRISLEIPSLLHCLARYTATPLHSVKRLPREFYKEVLISLGLYAFASEVRRNLRVKGFRDFEL